MNDDEGVELLDDDAALKYGKSVVSELKRDDPGGYLGWKMQIRKGPTVVASIPFAKPN